MIIPLVGCSKKADTTTPKVVPLTPMQVLTNRVNNSDTINARQDQNLIDLSNRMTTEIAAVSVFDHTPFTDRLVALEGLNMSTFVADLAFLNVRLATYDSYNISARLAALEARPLYAPTPNASVTPTPTPTSTPSGVNHPPVILSMSSVSMGTNQSWMIGCVANDSDSDVLRFNWAVTTGFVYPLASGDAVIWQLTTNGTQSIVCQVNDGKDGYDIEIKTVFW
jgi:hypothetical protein